MRRPHGIRKRVALLVGFGAVVPMLVALLAMRAAFEDVSAHLLAEHERLAHSLALHLDRDLRDHQAGLLAASGTPEDWANGSSRRALRALLLRSGILDAVALFASDSGAHARLLWQELRHGTVDETALLALPELGAAMHGRQGVARLVPSERFVLLVPVRDWNGQVTGVVAAVANPRNSTWRSVLRQGALGTGSASLVDEAGRIVASLGPVAEARDGRDIAATGKLTVVPWEVRIRQPRHEALAPLEVAGTRLAVLAPLLLALAVLFSWGASHSVTSPLEALGLAARRIADGNLDTPVPRQADDEVGQLGQSLESMRVALKKSMDELTGSRAALEQRVTERTRELRLLLTKFVSAQEDERRRIARELHDETCQTVAALGMKLDVAAAATSAPAMRERLAEARAFATRTLAEVHALIYELRPAVLDDLGLYPAIRWVADHQLTPAGIAFRCEWSGSEPSLSSERQTTLFRAVQEAIRNVARHSAASQVLIQVEERERELWVEIEDDGHGFDPDSVRVPGPSGRGLGLLGMRERLGLLGGSAEVHSSPEAGTRVLLRLPFGEEQHAA